MAKVNAVKRSGKKSDSLKNTELSVLLRRAEAKLKKKQEELILAKAQHRKLSGEYIDQYLIVSRLKKQLKAGLG